MRILVVDDEKDCCDDLSGFLSSFTHTIEKAYNAKDALEKNSKMPYDLIITDVNMPGMSGIEMVLRLNSLPQKPEIILISGKNEIIESINAIDLGVFDFLTKPVDIYELSRLIKQIDEKQQREKKAQELIQADAKSVDDKKVLNFAGYHPSINYSFIHPDLGEIGIFSEKMLNIYNKLKKLSNFIDIPILIEGPTGSGKEVIAQYIHYQSQQSEGPFIAINCANLIRDLFEAELFGYEKGSFTGADNKGREGKIKLAEKGTLFLDEITEIPLDLQVKLLRVIQEREYYKVGGNQRFKVNTRLIFATNKDIKSAVKKGFFRDDLYYRLSICPVSIPSLSDRKEEIIPLVMSFASQAIGRMNKKISGIETEILKKMENYPWNGNIRELKNSVIKAVLFCEKENLNSDDFETIAQNAEHVLKIDLNNLVLPEKPFNLEELNQAIVKKTLLKFNGNKSKAAEFLWLTRIQLYRRFRLDED